MIIVYCSRIVQKDKSNAQQDRLTPWITEWVLISADSCTAVKLYSCTAIQLYNYTAVQLYSCTTKVQLYSFTTLQLYN